MDHLAAPAPKVGAATAPPAKIAGPALADSAEPTEAARAGEAVPVEPATVGGGNSKNTERPSEPGALSVHMHRTRGDVVFESYAGILRGGAPAKNFLKKLLPFVFDERDFNAYSEIKKFCLITRDGVCFVYADESDPAPIYTLELAPESSALHAIEEDPNALDPLSVTIDPVPDTNLSPPYLSTVLLKQMKHGKHGKGGKGGSYEKAIEHQFTFNTSNDPTVGKRFVEVVNQALSKKKPTVTAKATTSSEKPAVVSEKVML